MNRYYVHPQAICETEVVGEGTRIWAFAHVLPGAKIGCNCNICDGVFVENDVSIGDEVTVKSGVQLWDGVELSDRVFVGPNVAFSNDRFPRSKRYPEQFARTVVESDASIGANATILPGIRIGFGAMIGAGAVIRSDVPSRAIVVGNPGRIVGYDGASDIEPSNGGDLPGDFPAKLIRFNTFDESRGRLVVSEGENLPFTPKRFFVVDRVPPGGGRGGHAHFENHQFFVAVSGNLMCVVDDGHRAFAVRLSAPSIGLYVPPLVWGIQYGHSAEAALLVLASNSYDPKDYAADYGAFRRLTRSPDSRATDNLGGLL